MIKIAAVLFLLLAVMALEAAGAEGSSGVPMREIDAGEILAKIQKGQPVIYDHVVVRGDLDLSRERLQKNITSTIRIKDSIFNGMVSFNGTMLEKQFDLSDSNFTQDACFSGTTFNENANFDRSTFSDDAYFWMTTFNRYTDFDLATFRGYVDFNQASFNGDANLFGGKFRSMAEFVGTTFNGCADFNDATFSMYTYFEDVAFSRNADFDLATFRGYVDFTTTSFSGDANFNHATFNSGADFSGDIFSSDASFVSTTFAGNSSFEKAEFNGNIEFGGARFENETSFYRILFKRPAYFENCHIKSLNLTKAEYSRLHLRWDDIKSLHFDEAAYLALIKNYNSLGWYGDANWCYYDYRNAVRDNWQAPSSGFAARLSSLLDRVIDFGEWLLYGYGVRPSFPIAWSAAIILAFGLFFRQKRCLRKIVTEEKIEDARDGSEEVLVGTTARKASINSLDPFLFSLFTFTSGFTTFLHPAVEYKLERCLRWAIAERLLGPFFLALVITTISKTYLIR